MGLEEFFKIIVCLTRVEHATRFNQARERVAAGAVQLEESWPMFFDKFPRQITPDRIPPHPCHQSQSVLASHIFRKCKFKRFRKEFFVGKTRERPTESSLLLMQSFFFIQ